jgi:hypothetical protein
VGREEPARTDSLGVLRVERKELAGLRPQDDRWSVLEHSGGADDQVEATLWICRCMRILGSVNVQSDLVKADVSKVQISMVAVGEDSSPCVIGRDRLGTAWYVRHSLYKVENLCKVAEDGSFEAQLPRIPGLAVSATLPGWQPDQVLVNIKSDPCVVRLALAKKSLLLTGTIRSAKGESIANASVAAYVTVRLPADQVSREACAAKGHGYKLHVFEEENRAILVYLVSGRTDENGVFTLKCNVTGELSLAVRPGQGMLTTFVRRGLAQGDRDDLDLVVEEGSASLLTILRSGAPLRNKRVLFGDHTLFEQPGFSVKLDDSGGLPACMLMLGHKYNVMIKGELGCHYFIWSGQESIDLTRLPKEPPWPFGR